MPKKDLEPMLLRIIGRLSVVQTMFAKSDDMALSANETMGVALIVREAIEDVERIMLDILESNLPESGEGGRI